MRIRQLLTLIINTQTITTFTLDIPVPSGSIIRVNSVVGTPNTTMTVDGLSSNLMVAVATRPLSLTVLRVSEIESHTAIFAYARVGDGILGVTTAMRLDAKTGLIIAFDDAYSFAPVLYLGQGVVSASTGVLDILFDIDYDVVKLTPQISARVSALQ